MAGVESAGGEQSLTGHSSDLAPEAAVIDRRPAADRRGVVHPLPLHPSPPSSSSPSSSGCRSSWASGSACTPRRHSARVPFVGLRNYEAVRPRQHPLRAVLTTVWNTVLFVIMSTPLLVGVGLFLAALLNQRVPRPQLLSWHLLRSLDALGRRGRAHVVVDVQRTRRRHHSFPPGHRRRQSGLAHDQSMGMDLHPYRHAVVDHRVQHHHPAGGACRASPPISMKPRPSMAPTDGSSSGTSPSPASRRCCCWWSRSRSSPPSSSWASRSLMTGGGHHPRRRHPCCCTSSTPPSAAVRLGLAAAMALIVAVLMVVVSIVNFRLFSSERA